MKITLTLLFAAALAFGQTATAPITGAPATWFVGSGVEVNTYATVYNTTRLEPFVHVGACWTAFCEITTMEFGGTSATVRQDVGYQLKSNSDKSAMLIAIAGGSLTVTSAVNTIVPTTINLGGVGGGFAVKVDPGVVPFLKSIKGKGVGILAEVRINNVSSQGVQPQLALSLNYRFK